MYLILCLRSYYLLLYILVDISEGQCGSVVC